MTYTQDSALLGNSLQTFSIEVLSGAKTFDCQPNNHYIVILKTGALPVLPSLLNNKARYTFRNTTGSPISLAFSAGETIDGSSSPLSIGANLQYTIASEVSAAAGWSILAPTPAPSGTTTATASTLAARDASANISADAFIPGYTTQVSSGGNTVLTEDSTQQQEVTGSSTHTMTLPTTNILKGRLHTVLNSATANLTLNGSAGGSVATIQPGWVAIVMAKIDTPTSGFSHWSLIGFFSTSSGFIDKTATANTLVQRTGQANIAADAFAPSLNSAATTGTTVVLTNDSTQDQRRTGSSAQIETLPTTSIVAGMYFEYWNQSSVTLTINSSGGNLVKSLTAGACAKIKAMVSTPTAAADWFATP